MATFTTRTVIATSPEACFDLSLSVDAHTSSMAASRERAVAGVVAGSLGPGETVTWQARHFGVPFRLTSQITDYVRPLRFVDEQTRGPFRRWRHTHTFVAEGSTTVMLDEVDYLAPCGVLGRLVERLVLTRYLKRLITRRNEWLRAELERGAGA